MRRCPGNGGRPCGTYMSPLFRDPHPTCTRCRSCSYNSTCSTSDGWSVDQWEHYRLKSAYAGGSKSSSLHAGDPIDTASNLPLSPTSARFVSPSPPSLTLLLPPPSEGIGEGSEAPSVANISAVNVNEPRVPSPTPMHSWEWGRDTSRVRDGKREAPSTSLASDPLEDKSPPFAKPD